MSRNDAGLGRRHETRRIGKTITGRPHKIGTGFSAIHFSEDMPFGHMSREYLSLGHEGAGVPTQRRVGIGEHRGSP
jgi:hypothetical protein